MTPAAPLPTDPAERQAYLQALAERERARQTELNEARYRDIVEDQTELISLARPDGTLLFVNGAYARHFGVTPQDAVGSSLYRFVQEGDRPAVAAHLAALCQHDKVVSGENRMRLPNGQARWMAWSNRAIRDAQGQVTAIHSVGRDITDYKLATQALQDSESRLRSLYERTPAMLYSIDARGHLLTVSDTWLAKLGYTRQEVIGRRSAEFLAPGSFEQVRQWALPAFFEKGVCSNVEYQMLRKDGSRMDVLMSAIMERDENGQHVRSVAILEDVTDKHAVEAALHANQERLSLATQANGIGIWELNFLDGQMVWSDMMFQVYDCDPSTFRGTVEDWMRLLHPDDVSLAVHHIGEALAGRQALDFHFRVPTRQRGLRTLHTRGTLFRDAQGMVTRLLGTNEDVTERKRIERELAEQHELLRVTLLSIGDGVITTDAQGLVQWLNPVAERMTGWDNASAHGHPLEAVFQVVDEHSRQPEISPLQHCLANEAALPQSQHTVLLARDGREYGIEDSAAPIRDAQGRVLGVVLVFHDVSEQRRMGHEMRFRAMHDPLTGLVNRAEFERRLNHTLERSHSEGSTHAMMYIDLDQFKLVNDACGHAMGDELLCQVTTLLQRSVRSRDTLARLGGDEFGVILEHCTVEQAQRVAQEICDQMEDFRFVHEGRRFRIGTSIGLVPVDRRWANMALVLQAADTACYAAKEGGRNRVHAWFDSDEALRARKGEMQWASRLEQAIDEDRFVLYAQRIVPLDAARQKEGLHAEVLLRLRDDGPEGSSLIPPAAFLPAAERFHLASRIDRWVLRQMLRWMEAHSDTLGHVATIAVNLSGQSIGDRAFLRFVADLVARTRFDVRKLCFEVTETAAITNLNDATLFIQEMRALGVRIALDDFGAGSSSFGYLKTLSVDYLKIDGQFIKNLTDNALDHAAVRCFRDVAQVLGITTIAEFVETEVAVTELRRIGIDYAQGFLVHRPEPLEAVLLPTKAPARD